MEGREKACIDKYDDLDVKKTTKTRKEKRKAHTHIKRCNSKLLTDSVTLAVLLSNMKYMVVLVYSSKGCVHEEYYVYYIK